MTLKARGQLSFPAAKEAGGVYKKGKRQCRSIKTKKQGSVKIEISSFSFNNIEKAVSEQSIYEVRGQISV